MIFQQFNLVSGRAVLTNVLTGAARLGRAAAEPDRALPGQALSSARYATWSGSASPRRRTSGRTRSPAGSSSGSPSRGR